MSSTTGTSAPPEPSALAPDTPSPGNSSYSPPMPMIFCAGAGVRMNILIVEDSRFLRISNERALARAGYQVITAADGEEGLRLARENKPDLVILDLICPSCPAAKSCASCAVGR